jgi:hypothetical protein
MLFRSLIIGFSLPTSLLLGQLDSNSVTVTASRNATLQPDQVVFAVAVESGLNTSLDDVLAALHGSGITMANFAGINAALQFTNPGISPGEPTIEWSFTLAAPLSKIKDTISTLNSVQQNITKQNKGLNMNFSVQGAQVSPQLALSQPCVLADLLADARVQAQKLASAAGFTVDTILAMSSATGTALGTGLASILSAPPCTVTVKFAIARFQ